MKSLLTTREKEKLIEDFEISRKSYAAFSKEKGINPHTFTTWVYKWRKAKEEKTEVSFVKINTSILKKEAKIKIKKADIKIEVPTDIDEKQLKNIITVLVEEWKLIMKQQRFLYDQVAST